MVYFIRIEIGQFLKQCTHSLKFPNLLIEVPNAIYAKESWIELIISSRSLNM